MAIRAIRPQRPLVHIFFGMTGNTINTGILVSQGLMAFTAGQNSMLAYQGKMAKVMVEPDPFLPSILVMTIPAIKPLLTLMNILRLMATAAGSLNLHIRRTGPMAGFTPGLGMLADKLEMGIPVMAERDRLPVRIPMTTVAFAPVLSLMDVINFMAINTLRAGLNLKQIAGMTSRTGRFGMPSFKRIFCFRAMVESDRLPPFRHMTTFTPFILRAVVGIIDQMAGPAIGR